MLIEALDGLVEPDAFAVRFLHLIALQRGELRDGKFLVLLERLELGGKIRAVLDSGRLLLDPRELRLEFLQMLRGIVAIGRGIVGKIGLGLGPGLARLRRDDIGRAPGAFLGRLDGFRSFFFELFRGGFLGRQGRGGESEERAKDSCVHGTQSIGRQGETDAREGATDAESS
ncbi:MAG: hypothetical protein QOE70_6397 [Chthoniobacter sp.]|nr:hypothetical protein [Chthoniobacter sp.]